MNKSSYSVYNPSQVVHYLSVVCLMKEVIHSVFCTALKCGHFFIKRANLYSTI